MTMDVSSETRPARLARLKYRAKPEVHRHYLQQNANYRAQPDYAEYDNDRHKARRRTPEGWCHAAFCAAKKRAKDKVPFSITYEDVLAQWPKDGKCPVLGVTLAVAPRTRANNSPSLDRYINHLGYVVGNIRVVSNRANLLKSDATVAELRSVIAYMGGTL